MCDFSAYGALSDEWLRLAAEMPAGTADQSLDDLKRATNLGREETARREMLALSDKVLMYDHSITARDGYSLEARTYKTSSLCVEDRLPIYIHFHGGGFLFGTLSSEDSICSRIAVATGVVVVNINYRHTPEYAYPVAWNDAEDGLRWIQEHAPEIGGDPQRIVVGGISAGAWLAAALAQANLRMPARTRASILGQVLMIPCLVYEDCYASQVVQLRNASVSSYSQNEHAPVLPLKRVKLFNSLLKVEDPDPRDRRLNPGNATSDEVRGLPPTTIAVAGSDPLRDEALLYGKLLAENG